MKLHGRAVASLFGRVTGDGSWRTYAGKKATGCKLRLLRHTEFGHDALQLLKLSGQEFARILRAAERDLPLVLFRLAFELVAGSPALCARKL
jgi:hypothetical protein